MKLYIDRSNLDQQTTSEILKYFFDTCNKINIYFPNEANSDLMNFKTKFLDATALAPLEDETSSLEPKEGFTMVIASLVPEVRELLLEITPSYHLSFGLIEGEQVILYFGEDGEIVIETDDESIADESLFKNFKSI